MVNLDKLYTKICAKTSSMRKDLKRPLAAQKILGAASGRLKILYDYILNNSKILLDTVWISYSNSDEQKFIEKVYFCLLYRKNVKFF